MTESNQDRSQLVLTRRPGQSIEIETSDGLIKVTQLTRWRIAIEAPPSVNIRRGDNQPSA